MTERAGMVVAVRVGRDPEETAADVMAAMKASDKEAAALKEVAVKSEAEMEINLPVLMAVADRAAMVTKDAQASARVAADTAGLAAAVARDLDPLRPSDKPLEQPRLHAA